MKLRNLSLAAAVAAGLGLAPAAGHAQQNQMGQIKWSGSVYAKFLDGNRYTENGLYSNASDTPGEGGGDQGQGIEFELKFNVQVSRQVEIGGRLHSRFNKNYWANYGGFPVPGKPTVNGCDEADPRCNQYVKLRGAWALITPGYEWMDSAFIGNGDWGMFDPWTHGKSRYIDRDNLGGVLLQGSALGKDLRWDVARITLPEYQGLDYKTVSTVDNVGRIYTNEANWIGQVRYSPSPDWNATTILMYASDDELENDDPNTLNGTGTRTRWDNTVLGLKGQYSGLGFVDLKGAWYHSNFNMAAGECTPTNFESCRFSPLPKGDSDGYSWTIDLAFNRLFMDGLSLAVQAFHVGADYQAITAARRESDVLLTEGQEATFQTSRPDYNFGSRRANDMMATLGYGGWNGEVQQVVSHMADNDFTDFDEPVAYSVIGWEGITFVPKLMLGDWEFAGEYSYITFDTNWQACGNQVDKDAGCIYPRMDGVHSWGLGGDFRSPYAPYQDKEMQIFALKAKYTLDIGNGVDLMARYKYVSDEDNRVTKSKFLEDAYDGFPLAAGATALNPNWIPNVGLGGCVTCDDRDADYDTIGISAGYQLTPDLYAKLIYEWHNVELIDGTIDVAPVGIAWDANPEFGWVEYLTGEHEKNRVGLNFSYFLQGVEFGGTFDYLWGTYDPQFYTDSNGKRVRLLPGAGVDTIATPVGDIKITTYDYGQYRMKVFMKVSF